MQTRSRSILLAALTVCMLARGACAGADTALPRRTGAAGQDESYPGVTVLYDFVRDAADQRLRLIVTHPDRPASPETRFATIFVVGWLSCDSVEAPPGSSDGTQRMLQATAQIPGFATVRLDKPGVGDSEGYCGKTDFTHELDAYRRAFRHLRSYSFVDPARVFLFGMSNGGGFAPLVADGAPVKGYVVDGGWIKTWFEHMLEIERRRLFLSGTPPAEINALMTSVEKLYSAYLLERRSPHEIFADHPQLRKLWEGADTQQYGRPTAYYQQLQDLNLMSAWSSVRAPVLALHGEYDWVMSRGDFELLVELVNRTQGGGAELIELAHTGHTFEHYASLQEAFAGRQLPFDEAVAQRVQDWFVRHRDD
jgi:pimeloyl-ACP methyl ester carboxylesterase